MPPETAPPDLLATFSARKSVPKPPALFLKGPVPWAWLETAMSLPGRALHVGLLLWFEVGLRKSDEVALSFRRLRYAGISRWTAARGLQALEGAGLVEVTRGSGRKPRVRVVREK